MSPKHPFCDPAVRAACEDRRKGALYGQAIGDALGMAYEFDVACSTLAEGELVQYQPPDFNQSSMGFLPGAWTDDTQQAVALAWATLDPGDPVLNFARRMYDWRVATKDCGHTTALVVGHPDFQRDPLKASKEIWVSFGRDRAANGGVMRAVGGALAEPWDGHKCHLQAANLCRVTHFDPRCVASAVAVTEAVCDLICGSDIEQAIERAVHLGGLYDKGSETYIRVLDLDSLDLSGNNKGFIGFTYQCLGAGFWALHKLWEVVDAGRGPEAFWPILSAVIRADGDTDTNAAVAGALMGAYLGYSKIPQPLIDGLRDKDQLDAVLAALPPVPDPETINAR